MKLRFFHDTDLTDISKIESSSFTVGAYSLMMLKSMIYSNSSFTIVIEENNKIIGYGTAAKLNKKSMDIESIAILPEYQGKGYGSKLIEAVEDEIKKRNYKTAVLEVREKNENAKSFYLNHGYKIVDFIENYYLLEFNKSRNAYRMEKDL